MILQGNCTDCEWITFASAIMTLPKWPTS